MRGLGGGQAHGLGGDQLHDGGVTGLEADIVAGHGLGQRLMVHLDGLDLSGEADRGEGDDLAGLHDAGLDTAHGQPEDGGIKKERQKRKK